MEVHQMSNKHPILGRGELYVKDIEKRYYGGPQKLPHTYHENKLALIKDITSIQEEVQRNDEIFLQEKVVCIRMEPKFEAKSYSPDMLLSVDGITPIGGRKYVISKSEEGLVKSKLYFAKTSDRGLENLKHILESWLVALHKRNTKHKNNPFKQLICSILQKKFQVSQVLGIAD